MWGSGELPPAINAVLDAQGFEPMAAFPRTYGAPAHARRGPLLGKFGGRDVRVYVRRWQFDKDDVYYSVDLRVGGTEASDGAFWDGWDCMNSLEVMAALEQAKVVFETDLERRRPPWTPSNIRVT